MEKTTVTVSGRIMRKVLSLIIILSVMMSLTACKSSIEGEWEFYSVSQNGMTVTVDDLGSSYDASTLPSIEVTSTQLILHGLGSSAAGVWAEQDRDVYIIRGNDGSFKGTVQDDKLILSDFIYTGTRQSGANYAGVTITFRRAGK